MHGVAVANGAPTFIEGLPPIKTDDIRAGFGHFAKQASSFNAKVDDRHAHLLDRVNEAQGSVEGVLAIVGEAERTDPTVEDLNDVGAGLHLEAAVLLKDLDDLVEQQAPGQGVAVHHPLGVDVVLGATALDHVAGQGLSLIHI